MRLLVVYMISTAWALPFPDDLYSQPPADSGVGGAPGGGYSGGADLGGHNVGCGSGLVQGHDGSCVQPVVKTNIFVFAAPHQPLIEDQFREVPVPKIQQNIVFIRAPETGPGSSPIIVPPPQQKTQVYVLAKRPAGGSQQVIEVPAGPKQTPEVFFVHYSEGDNPQLPGGVDLQAALTGAAQPAQIFGQVNAADFGFTGGSSVGLVGGNDDIGIDFSGQFTLDTDPISVAAIVASQDLSSGGDIGGPLGHVLGYEAVDGADDGYDPRQLAPVPAQ